ncbi:hypothetical protein VNO77_19479 [Canavalia gladiata]|uniref:Uncharacterized protein n=1 Tax=Canavalia gladiata TaxID=3824 RepID=A0AAN9LMJ3_CANGL
MTSRFCQSLILGILFVALVLPSEPATALSGGLPGYACSGDYKSSATCLPNCKTKGCLCIGEGSDFTCCCKKK